MPAHGVRKGNLEKVVVANAETTHHRSQVAPLPGSQFGQAAMMILAHQQGFERPHCPERHNQSKVIILTNHPFF